MSHVAAVFWKEWNEHFLRRGRPSKTVWASMAFVALAGVIGPGLVTYIFTRIDGPVHILLPILTVAGVFAMAFQGLVGAASLIVDAIAGERERHTLESLLASPLPDHAILAGKVGAILAFCGGTALVLGLAEQLTLLALFGPAAFSYAPAILAGVPLALGTGALVASVGVLVSMRAPSVKAGQQLLGYALLPVYLMPGLLQPILLGTPFGRSIIAFYDAVGPEAFVLLVLAVLAALAGAFLTLGGRLFRRDRLLLARR